MNCPRAASLKPVFSITPGRICVDANMFALLAFILFFFYNSLQDSKVKNIPF